MHGLNSHLDLAKERINKLEKRLVENIQTMTWRTEKVECTEKPVIKISKGEKS